VTDPLTLAAAGAIFLLAGTVKGVIGHGLPTISLGLLAVFLDLPAAMALILVPSLLANLWQGAVGGHAGAILRRIWPFLLMATVTVWLGSAVLQRVDAAFLKALLGVVLIAYGMTGLSGHSLAIDRRSEPWPGVLMGIANGVLTGMTGSFVIPGVIYLRAIGLPRDLLVQAMGMLFGLSTLALGAALGGHGLLTFELGAASLAAVVPALAGIVIGRWIRERLSEKLFRRVFFLSLLLLGAYICGRAFFG
jgi:uncharacterized membrane protein YfcA